VATKGEELARFGGKAFVICDAFLVGSLLLNFQEGPLVSQMGRICCQSWGIFMVSNSYNPS